MKTLYYGVKHEGGWKYVRSLQVADNFDIGEEGSDTRKLVDELLLVMSHWAGDMGHTVTCSYAGGLHPDESKRKENE